ncbi:MAG: Chaperone protein DnaK, partial [Polyangiaceae bacterium]|nr:Chaperone protein DnaK [Polyangiaceae bacterium]
EEGLAMLRQREDEERAARDQAARDQAARDQAARDQAARDQAARDQAARDQAARDQAARDQAARDQAARRLEVPVPPVPFAPPPPPVLQATAQGHGFGNLELNLPSPGGGGGGAPIGTVTAPLQAIGLTTQKLPTAPPAPMPPPPLLVDVTPLTLAVETVEGFCDSLIPRNTTVPCSRTREFVTAADNQTSVRVRVSQGESSRFGENTLLGEVELSGLRPARRGDVRIAVSFALDSSGMLVVSAKDVGTGRETSTHVHLVGLPDAQEIARMAARQAGRGV